MRKLIFNIDKLYTCDAADRVLSNGYIVIENGLIVAIGEGRPDGSFGEEIDLGGCIGLPGFVNMHHHFFQTLTRAIPGTLRGHLIDWLRLMYPLWSGMTPDDLKAAGRATMSELLLTGATTTVDHAYLMPGCDPAFTDALAALPDEMDMRLHLIRGSMTSMEGALQSELTPVLGEGAGGLVDAPDAVLADMARALKRYHSTSHGSKLSVGLGPTTTTYDNPAYMAAVGALAADFDCDLHIHFHPRPDERALCREQFGSAPMDFLEQAGWMRPGTFFAHGTRLELDDMRRMADAGVALAHCPRMILRLGARTTPVHDLRAQGVKVGVGVDGGASNDSGSMLGEMRIALLLHRLAGGEGEVPWQQWLSPYELLKMATVDAAAILRRSDIGNLSVGACADFTAFDMTGIGFAGARSDLLSGLLLAGDDTRAAMTMVGGKVKVLDGKLVGADERQLRSAVDTATSRLIDRASALTGANYYEFS